MAKKDRVPTYIRDFMRALEQHREVISVRAGCFEFSSPRDLGDQGVEIVGFDSLNKIYTMVVRSLDGSRKVYVRLRTSCVSGSLSYCVSDAGKQFSNEFDTRVKQGV